MNVYFMVLYSLNIMSEDQIKYAAQMNFLSTEGARREQFIKQCHVNMDAGVLRFKTFCSERPGDYMVFIHSNHQAETWKKARELLNIKDSDIVYSKGPIKNSQYLTSPRRLWLNIVKIPDTGVFNG